ncbi:MAG TPA: DUF6065 family protein [Polyangia bacterium]|nr:DUF6065 family protein [Polyangia bacterium]
MSDANPEEASAPVDGPSLTAYVVNDTLAMPLVPAQRARAWMDATNARFANRCLPLLMANQAGWFLVSAHTLRLTWNGANDLGAVTVEHLDGPAPTPAASHFGSGIVTWNVPYLFRTSPGYNLLVRGAANWPKDGVAPLEGLVETDWSSATFTVNWQMTRPHFPVTVEIGEPLCMLVPQRRGELEAFHPQLRMLGSEPPLDDAYRTWSESRAKFNAELAQPDSSAARQRWQKHYFQGVSAESAGDDATRGDHQTKLQLRPFADRRASPPAPERPAALSADEILRGFVIIEDFVDAATCASMVALHKRRGSVTQSSDNAFVLSGTRDSDPHEFELTRTVLERLVGLIDERFGAQVKCDLSVVCALPRRGFRHTLHADNALVACPRHGTDQEELRRQRCRCPDAGLRPNHTPWRTHTALLYLSGDHRGGDIVFGDGPNAWGGIYRKQIRPRPGLLVLTPSNEHYFHHTTPVTAGVRYSMNNWFTTDASHVAADWLR